MKKTTRIVSLLLALVMLAGILPSVAPTVVEAASSVPADYYNHLPTTATDVVYLSDMNFEYSVNYGSKVTVPDKQINGTSTIKLGAYTTVENSSGTLNVDTDYRTTFTKGLGVQPRSTSAPGETVVDLADNEYEQSYFYSVAGITNQNINMYTHGCEFAVWASYDRSVEDYTKAEFVLLESSGTLTGCEVYQFHLDITGARYLKLVVSAVGGIASTNSAWGGTCVYNNPGYSPKTDMISARTSDGGEYVAFADRDETFISQTPTMFNEFECMFNSYNYMNLPENAINLSKSYGTSIGTVLIERFTPGVGNGANWLGGTHYAIVNQSGASQTETYQKDGIKFPASSTVYFKNKVLSDCSNGVAEGYVVYDISGLNVDTFYSMVGVTDQAFKYAEYNPDTGKTSGKIFEVWGDYGDGNGYVLLSASEVITKSNTGEFFVDITGVQKLKLRHYQLDSRTGSTEQWHGAFGYASVYNRENTAEVYKTNMSLENSLPMSFAVEQSKVADLTNPYAKITYGDNVEVVNFNEWKTETIENVDYYRFTYQNIAAKEMTDTVSVTIYDGYMPVAQVYEDTVQAYCLRQLANAKNDGDTALEKVLVDLLNYGAAAQEHFDYNTGALANGVDLSDYTGSSTTPTYTNNLVTSGTGYYKTNVALESNIKMKFAFTGLTEGMTAKITFTHHNSNTETTVDAEIVTDGSYGIVTLDELVVADCRQDVTVTIYDGETEICSVTDSVASYLARKAASDDSAVFDALMTLCDSAYAYFHPTTA